MRLQLGTRLPSWLAEFSVLLALFLLIDGLVLKLVFPKFVDPFWPLHSDFYIPAALAYSPAGFWKVLSYPRPVGYAFFWLIGHLKTRGAMAAVLLVVGANYSLLVMTLIRLFRLPRNVQTALCCAVFAMMVASHPYQYQFSIWDAFSELSLLFLLLAINLCLRGGGFWMPVGLTLLAFLSKETYFVSAAFMAGAYAISQRLRPASLLPGVGVVAAGLVAFACERLIGSPFTAGGAGPDDPYRVVVGFASVWHQWLQYLSEGFNQASAAVVVLAIVGVAVGTGARSKETVWSMILPAAGLAALLPNCLLPNHHFAAYTWNTAYFFYAPIVMLGATSRRKAVSLAAVVATVGVALYSPVLSTKAFADQQWLLMNQRRQRHLLSATTTLARAIPRENESILVSGLDFPYSMFEYRSAAKSLGAPAGTKFYVIDYHAGKAASIVTLFNKSDDSVSLVAPVRAKTLRFDEAWLIRDDGALIAKLQSPALPPAKGGFSPAEMLVYPALIDILGSVVHGSMDGYAYLRCGTRLLEYDNLTLAQRYLEAARPLIPDNPYPYYWLGVTFERQGKRSEARAAYQQAVAHQATSPNPAFQDALARVQ